MTSAAEHRHPPHPTATPSQRAADPVLLVAPDGKIVDANMAAESFSRFRRSFCAVSR